jgi:cytidylate kinase
MKDKNVPVITLDGPSGTGKGTICHLLANHLQWHVLDSGSIYRVLALTLQRRQIALDNIVEIVQLAHALNLRFETGENLESRALLDNEDVFDAIRSEACGQDASKIAAIPEVRTALLARQRAFAQLPGLVTDGRDMGTVVFPEAFLKIFLFATDEVRAKRRYFQLKEKGIDVTLAQVVDELSKRDARDSTRLCAPLKPAEDAVILDTSELNIDQVFARILKLLDKKV